MTWFIYGMVSLALLFMSWAIRKFLAEPKWQVVAMGVVMSAVFVWVAFDQMHDVTRDDAHRGVDWVGAPIPWQERELTFSQGSVFQMPDGTTVCLHMFSCEYIDGKKTTHQALLALNLLLWLLPLLAFWIVLLKRKPKLKTPRRKA